MGDISRMNDLSAPQFSVGPLWRWIAQTDRKPASRGKEKTVRAVRGAETNTAHPQSAALEKRGPQIMQCWKEDLGIIEERIKSDLPHMISASGLSVLNLPVFTSAACFVAHL